MNLKSYCRNYKVVLLQKVSKKKQHFFSKIILKNYQKDRIKDEFNLYLDTLGRHLFYPYGTRTSKKMQIDLDDTVYSFHLSEINFYACIINRNLHNYILEEITNF